MIKNTALCTSFANAFFYLWELCFMQLVEYLISEAAASSELACTSSTSAQTLGDKLCENLRSVWVSAFTGAGMDAFKRTIDVVAEENMKNYK